MKRALLVAVLVLSSVAAVAQLKPRPDAFPPQDAPVASKAVTMASDIGQMAGWDRYPTYETYLAMMQRWVEDYPLLCQVDTIGYSVRGRLILCMHIEGGTGSGAAKPQFFYSSTIHGDEVTGYVMMLRLIDTLLSGYGSNAQYTDLMDRVAIYINPLANPDGTYNRGNNTVQGAIRYNANYVDLNRNYPDPFGTGAKAVLQPENEAMIDYVERHDFRLSANLHGGSEVMNFPWDCFTSLQNPHPQADWWRAVCQRFVDTSRTVDATHFSDVNAQGYIAGGDWYVIHGGRQDYMNYYQNCLELTMEISVDKTLACERLPEYWGLLQHSLVNYISETLSLPEGQTSIGPTTKDAPVVYVRDRQLVVPADCASKVQVFDLVGRQVRAGVLSPGVYLVHLGERGTSKVIVL